MAVALAVAVIHVLAHQVAEVVLPERYDPAQALLFDQSHEPLGMDIEVRAPCRELDWLNTLGYQDLGEGPDVERIAIVDEMTGVAKESVDCIGEVAAI